MPGAGGAMRGLDVCQECVAWHGTALHACVHAGAAWLCIRGLARVRARKAGPRVHAWLCMCTVEPRDKIPQDKRHRVAIWELCFCCLAETHAEGVLGRMNNRVNCGGAAASAKRVLDAVLVRLGALRRRHGVGQAQF